MSISVEHSDNPVAIVDLESLKQLFQGLYGNTVPRFFRAPGRVNLIGEHTDYNDGFVMPIAINWTTIVAASPRVDRQVRVYSVNRQEQLSFDLDGPVVGKKHHWLSYIEGVARSLEEMDWRIRGADLLINSDVPVGSGLSSSAALENSVGYALLKLAGYDEIDLKKLALAGQAAEHHYVGTKCGLMDQFITAMGQPGHALLIDCRSLEATPIPIRLADIEIVICDSGVKHQLATSAYNQRREECSRGLAFFQSRMAGLHSLRDLSVRDFERHADEMPDDVLRRRVKHVVTENQRTLEAADALTKGDGRLLGQKMNASHESLKYDYEVSCDELDALVVIAHSVPGVLGARMTGGGFGGCTVNLVQKDSVEPFKQAVLEAYPTRFGKTPVFYQTQANAGVSELKKV